MAKVNSPYNLVNAVCMLLMLLASNGVAQTSKEVSEQIIEHVNAQRFEQAYQLASAHNNEWEGEPDFDLAYGLAARGVGHLQQALFAFERVLEANPSSLNARFYVAVCYFELGNLAAATSEFNLLDSANPPQSMALQVNQYLAAIAKRKNLSQAHWQNWLQASVGNDSNPNNGIDDESIFIPLLGDVNVFAQNREVESALYSVSAQLAYLNPINQQDMLFVSGSVLHSEYEDSLAWSRTFIFAQLGYQTRWQDYQLVASAFYRPVWLDNDDYLDYSGIQLSGSTDLSSNIDIGAELILANEQYAGRPVLDRNQYLLNLHSGYRSDWGKHTFNVRLGTEQADDSTDDFVSRDLWSVGYRLQRTFDAQWSATFSAEWLSSEHDLANPLFESVREDDLIRLEAEVRYQIAPDWRAFVKLMHLDNDSNQAIYSYVRSKIGVGVRYDF